MNISASSTTDEVLSELGERLQAYRIQQNLSVAQLATKSGVGFRTINRAEAGDNASLKTVIKLLRALGRLDALESFLPKQLVSPLQLAEMQGHERQRAFAPRPNRARRARLAGQPDLTETNRG